MANWNVLNKEFDELIDKLTDSDWEQFEIYLKAKKQALNLDIVSESVCTNKYDCYFQTIDMKCNDKTMVCKHRKTVC